MTQRGRCTSALPLYSAPSPALARAFRARTTNAPRVRPMKEYEQEDPIPQGDLA
ncbi:MAG TPA: acyl-CoA thioesterase, partial [Pseudomonas sp.]|nr:acyl-CoA thioesterase [Pseudomonas sp.]